MAKLIYRVVSACGALGYGFPKSSMELALKGRIDAVISDAGSMDAGPYYVPRPWMSTMSSARSNRPRSNGF